MLLAQPQFRRLAGDQIAMPFKPLKPCACPGCPRLTAGRYCDEHQRTEGAKYYRYGRDPETRKRYDTRWTRIRAAFLREHPLCEECAKAGRMVPAREVHHVKPLSDGGTHDTENLMALCKSCHSAITLAATHRRTPPP